jgi:hypothetical protein
MCAMREWAQEAKKKRKLTKEKGKGGEEGLEREKITDPPAEPTPPYRVHILCVTVHTADRKSQQLGRSTHYCNLAVTVGASSFTGIVWGEECVAWQ